MCPARPSEILALIAMRNLPVILGRTMDIIGENVRTWSEFFTRHQEAFEWVAPSAGKCAVINVKNDILHWYL